MVNALVNDDAVVKHIPIMPQLPHMGLDPLERGFD
jgi:hypothetical protein